MSAAKAKGLFCENITSNNNEAARLASQKFYLDTYCDKEDNFYGSNDTDNSIIRKVHDKQYVFPSRCIFYCYDVKEMEKRMELDNRYNFILLDPPWWNRSIRRKKIKCTEAR